MNDGLDKVVARINATYGSWNRKTSIDAMRRDWDQLFASTNVTAITEDLEVNGLACRWIRSPAIASQATVLYIHGGGFRLGSVNSHLKLMNDIACGTQCQVFGFDYSLMPDAIFPTQLQQTVGIYRWLLDQGYRADQIVVAGDSAGGNLAAGLQQHIKQKHEHSLPQPAGTILLSAWLDMTLSGESYFSREDLDPVHQTKMLAGLAKLYAGDNSDLSDPLLSPLMGDLGGLPPALLQVGDCEVGLDDSTSYASKLQDSGGHAEISIWPNMIHVFQMFPEDLPQAREALREISAFIHKVVPMRATLQASKTAARTDAYLSRAKITPPSLPPQEVERSRLIDDLSDRKSARKLTVLQAPAGYGKSTMMRQVLARYQAQNVITIWLNLDESDNDVSRFLAGFSMAVAPYSQQLNEASYRSLRNQELAHSIIEGLNAMVEPTAIFFDNMECIRNPAVSGLIARGIEALPSNCCILISSRTPPAVGMAKLAAKDQLNDIQAADLRFSEAETKEFFLHEGTVALPDAQTRKLHQRTDGWPVALKLAALALEGKSNASHFIANFSGTNAAVAAYLAEEVLTSLPESTQDLLLQSSILDEVNVDICSRILQRSDCLAVLTELQGKNLFVSKSENQSFYYHSLFRDFLQTQLQRRFPKLVSQLHLTASQVYLQEERPVPAMRHALKAGEIELALDLLHKHADRLVSHGRIGLLTRLLDQMPKSMLDLDQHLHLKLIYALCVTYTRGPQPAYEMLAKMDESKLPADSAAYLMALRPLQLGMMDRIEEAHLQGVIALEKMADNVPNARITLSQALTQTSIILGEHEKAHEYCDQARYSPSSKVDIFNLALAESAESGMELMAGRLKQASNRINLAIERQTKDENRRGRGISMASIQLAEILYEQGDCTNARRLLATNSALVQDMGPPDSLIIANVILSRIVADAGESEFASQLLIELENSGHRLSLPRVVASARLERSRLWLAQGDAEGARVQLDLAKRTYDWDAAKDLWFGANDTLTPEITELRWLLRMGQSKDALISARNQLKAADHRHRVRRALKLRIMLAEAQFNCGDRNSALRTMKQASEFAGQEGFVRTFLEEGPALRPIFSHLDRAPPGLIQSPESGSKGTDFTPAAPALQANAAMPSEVRLTKKELDVLTVLAMGLSNVAMAEKLFVSESTVRTHLRNINSKLDAKSRTEAVSIARQLGLIR